MAHLLHLHNLKNIVADILYTELAFQAVVITSFLFQFWQENNNINSFVNN